MCWNHSSENAPHGVGSRRIRNRGPALHRILSVEIDAGVNMPKLYVSYARENKRAIDELVGHLSILGFETGSTLPCGAAKIGGR